jgi:GT2 family glycosyltransferase
MRGVYIYQDHKNPMPVDWISGTFFLFKREMLKEVGNFDEHYFMYYEDIDLSKRIRKKGKEIYYFPKIEITHYQRMGSVIDYGESPYIYYNKFFGLHFAKILRYILLLKFFLRIGFFLSLFFFSKKVILREKLRSNYDTFKYHLFEAPRVLRSLKFGSKS